MIYNEQHALYSSPSITMNLKSKRVRWAEHMARMEQSINTYRILVEKPEENGSLGRPRHGWEDNIKMDLSEVGCDAVNWIDFAQERDQGLIKAVMNPRVP